jgi:hypothetical protein
MNYISNVFSYIYSVFYKQNDLHQSFVEPSLDEPIIDKPIIDKTIIDKPIIDEPIIDEPIIEPTNMKPKIKDSNKDFFCIFINTANIYNASKLMLTKLKTDEYNNKYIKIYLLKSDTLEPLFKNPLKVNKYNIELIKSRLCKCRRHLHTLIEAIDSFVEYNNIKNYHVFY